MTDRPGTVLAAAITAAVGLILAGRTSSGPAHVTGDVPQRHDRTGVQAARLPQNSPDPQVGVAKPFRPSTSG